MRIIVATKNKAKLEAVEAVFGQVWSDSVIVGESFPSDVSDQPLCEEEGIAGALNRARRAQMSYPEADYCVGLEGYVETRSCGMFLAGAVAVMRQDGEVGIGISAKVQLPVFLKERIEQGEELGPLVRTVMNDAQGEIRQGAGTNGILTKGLYSRVDEFKDATACALARFVSPEFYS